jgi:hypothetical protein
MSVRVLSNPRVLHLTGVGLNVFLHLWLEPDLRRTGFGCGFRFSLAGAPETRKNPETRKTPEKNSKPKRNKKTPKETHLQNPTGTRTWPKTGRVQFQCQISLTGSGVKFNLIIFFHRSGFWSTRPVAIPNRAHQWWGRGWHNVSFHATTCPTTYQEATKKTRKTREQGGQREENMEKCKNSLSRPKSMVQVWDPPMTFRKIVK